MDCKTARLLFDFARPNATELEPADAVALNGHLDQCPDCATAVRSERRFDDTVGTAMRNVTVPVGLRQNILGRLAAERGAHHRRQIGHVIRGLVAASLLIGAVWGGVRFFRPVPRQIDVEVVLREFDEKRIAPWNAADVVASFRAQNVDVPVPANLRWTCLAATPSLTVFEGCDKVPMLIFVRRDGQEFGSEHACVYLLSARQFDLKRLPTDVKSSGNYRYRAAVLRHDDDFAFLIIHTGDNWDWLKQRSD